MNIIGLVAKRNQLLLCRTVIWQHTQHVDTLRGYKLTWRYIK